MATLVAVASTKPTAVALFADVTSGDDGGVAAGGSAEPVEFTNLQGLVAPVYAPALLALSARAMGTAVLPLHALNLGFSYGDVGLLAGLLGAGSVSANIPAGAFAAAFGPRALLLLSFGLLVAGSLGCAAASGLGALGFSCFVLGAADSAGILSRQLFLSATVAAERRAKMMACHSGAARVSYVIGPLLGGVVAHRLSPRMVFATQAGNGLLGLVLVFASMPFVRADQDLSGGSHKSKSSGTRTPKVSAAPTTLTGVVVAHGSLLASVCLFLGSLSTLRRGRELLFALVGHRLDLSQEQVGYFVSASFTLDAFMFSFAEELLNTQGRIRTGTLSCIGLTLAIFCLQGGGLAFYALFSAIAGLANGISTGLVSTIGADIAPPHCRGQFLSLYRTLNRLSELVAPLLVGFVAQSFSLELAESMLCLVGVLGATWAACYVKETRPAEVAAAAGAVGCKEEQEALCATPHDSAADKA